TNTASQTCTVTICITSIGTHSGSIFTATAAVADLRSVPTRRSSNLSPALAYYSGTFTTLAALDAVNPSALPGSPSAADPYTVVASFADSADYKCARALVSFSIAQAGHAVSVSDAGGTYSGAAFQSTT